MTNKKHHKSRLRAPHFLIIFWVVTALLALTRSFVICPASDHEESDEPEETTTLVVTDPAHAELAESRASQASDTDTHGEYDNTSGELANLPDTIAEAHEKAVRIFRSPRLPIAFFDADGNLRNTPPRKLDYSAVFNDLNDVQLNTAEVIGAPECKDRADAANHTDRYVYVGGSPFYDIEQLTYSVPYLVPHAAILLDEIGRAFMDSLTTKGIPFHKMVVTSLLRTNADVEILTRRNRNATEQSCHRFGTTFDIAYTTFHRVADPDGPKQQEWSAKELMPILAEVLEDQHQLGTCYIKHEVRKRCFHITVR